MKHRHALSRVFVPVAAAIVAGVVFVAAASTGARAQQTESVELFNGCNNVSLTWPSGTATSVVAASISPASSLNAIWRLNNVAQTFQGFAPQFPTQSDLTTVNRIDAVFVCMSGPGTLSRPVLAPGGGTATATTTGATATGSPTATATAAAVQPQLVFVGSPVARGSALQLTVQASAGVSCVASVTPTGGQPIIAGPAVANASGVVIFSVPIPAAAQAGTATIAVDCGGRSTTGTATLT